MCGFMFYNQKISWDVTYSEILINSLNSFYLNTQTWSIAKINMNKCQNSIQIRHN